MAESGGSFSATAGDEKGKLELAVDQVLQQAVNYQNPTVFVGLGGTGLKVLARLRQRIYQRYSDPDYWPHYAFMAIDSDHNDLLKGGQTDRKGLRVEPGDCFGIGMDPNQVATVLDQMGSGSPFAYMGQWLPSKAANYRTFGFSEGAAQMRAAGRMLFVYHLNANDIAQKLTAKCEHVRSAEALKASQAKQASFSSADPATDVVIIASIGGGTGSGCFLDFAYLARYLFRRKGVRIGEVRGMLVLPDAFTNGDVDQAARPVVNANGYAAIRELEYYSSGRGPFQPARAWGPSWLTEPFDDKPFNICYLFSRSNGAPLAGSDELYDLLADSLFFSIGGTTLAATMRSNWSNAQRYVNKGELSYVQAAETPDQGGPVTLEEADVVSRGKYAFFKRQWSTSYSSLGIASITMNLPELRRIAAVRQMRRLIEFELGHEPVVDDPDILRSHQSIARALLNQSGFIPDTVTNDVDHLIEQAAASVTGGQAESEAEAILYELRTLVQSIQVVPAKPDPIIREMYTNAINRGRTDAEAALKNLGTSHRIGHYFVGQVIADLDREMPVNSGLRVASADHVSVRQWKDLAHIGTSDVFGLGKTAEEIIRNTFHEWIKSEADAFLDQLNSALRRHYLTAALEVLHAHRKRIAGGIEQLASWDGRLREEQKNLVTAFHESRNRVLTSSLASQPDHQNEPFLDQEIDQALDEKFGGPRLQHEERLSICRDRTLAWLRIKHPYTPGTLLAAKREVGVHDPEAVEQMVDFIAVQLLIDLPGQKDIFQQLQALQLDLNGVLPDIERRANCYWHMNKADPSFDVPVGRVSLASVVVSPQLTAHQQNARRLLTAHGWKFIPSSDSTPGAPIGELVLVNEAHGLGLPTFATIADWKRQHDEVVDNNQSADRYLDRGLISLLPDLLPISPAEAQKQVNAWDNALLAIVLGYLEWSDADQSYFHLANGTQRVFAGSSYEAVGTWLVSSANAHYRMEIEGKIVEFFSARFNRPDQAALENSQDPTGARKAEALAQVHCLKLLDLLMELLQLRCFPPEGDDGEIRHYPPDHVMTRRIRFKITQKFLAPLMSTAGVRDKDIRRDLAWNLHQYVRFVGPKADGKGSALRPGLRIQPRGRRLLQLIPDAIEQLADGPLAQPGTVRKPSPQSDRDSRAVLNEAVSLDWYKHLFLVTAEQLKSLFPDEVLPGESRPLPASAAPATQTPRASSNPPPPLRDEPDAFPDRPAPDAQWSRPAPPASAPPRDFAPSRPAPVQPVPSGSIPVTPVRDQAPPPDRRDFGNSFIASEPDDSIDDFLTPPPTRSAARPNHGVFTDTDGIKRDPTSPENDGV